MIGRRRFYIGGPLNGQPVERVGDHWSHFRDDTGRPIPREVGDAVMYAEPAKDRQHYYNASLPAGGGSTYVHLTLFDLYLKACSWQAEFAAAEEEFETHYQ